VVTKFSAADPDGVPGKGASTFTYKVVNPATLATSPTAGADSGKFVINPETGELTFKLEHRPNYELPGDSGGDRSYEVTVEAEDEHGQTVTQTITVNVTDVNEAPSVDTANPLNLLTLNSEFSFQNGKLVGITEGTYATDTVIATVKDIDEDTGLLLDYEVKEGQSVSTRFAVDTSGSTHKLIIKAGATFDYEDVAEIALTLSVWDSTVESPGDRVHDAPVTLSLNFPVANVTDTLTLSTQTVTVQDVNESGVRSNIAVQGAYTAPTQTGERYGTLTFDASQSTQSLNRSNLLKLFDGNAATTGTAPVVQFQLKPLASVASSEVSSQVGVSMLLGKSAAQSGSDSALELGLSFNLDLKLTRANGGLELSTPAQTVSVGLTINGKPLTSNPITLTNAGADFLSLVDGNNAANLAVRLDALLDRADNYQMPLSMLSSDGAAAIAGSVVVGLLGDRTLSQLISMSRDVSELTPQQQALTTARLIEVLQDAAVLPQTLRDQPLTKLIELAGETLGIASDQSVKTVLTLLRDGIALPDSLAGKTLGELKTQFAGSIEAATMDRLETLVRAVLSGNPSTPNNSVNLNVLELPELMTLVINSNFANLTLSAMQSQYSTQFGGIELGEALGLAARVIDDIYGNVTVASLLDVAVDQISLPGALGTVSTLRVQRA
jgi:VCBS repeat-containing protein